MEKLKRIRVHKQPNIDEDAYLLEWELDRIIDRTDYKNKSYLPIKAQRYKVCLSVKSRERRLEDIQIKKKKDKDDLFAGMSREEIFGNEAQDELEIYFGVDLSVNSADLVVSSKKIGHKTFSGTLDQVRDLLDFIKDLISFPVRYGDKVVLIWSDENISMSYEVDESTYYDVYADYGWQPDSSEHCSDSEKEVFFPNK